VDVSELRVFGPGGSQQIGVTGQLVLGVDESPVTQLRRPGPGSSLVLSLFPGLDLFGRGFEAEGYTVVRGPDLILAGDIRDFRGVPGRFDGVIGGPPCTEWSLLNRDRDRALGEEMLQEFLRVVAECEPEWWLMENVPTVPDVALAGYAVQRLDLTGLECGGAQRRRRHFQFGSRLGDVLVPDRRQVTEGTAEPAALASEGQRVTRRSWRDFCALQGLPPLELPEFTQSGRYRLVGNGVAVPVARALARAVTRRRPLHLEESLCRCGCGRPVTGRGWLALPACRQRVSRARRFGRDVVTAQDAVGQDRSQVGDDAGVCEWGPVTLCRAGGVRSPDCHVNPAATPSPA